MPTQGVSRGGHCFAVVVEFGERVEDDDPRDGGSGEGQFDGVGQMFDGGGDEYGFGLGDDRCQRRERCAGLQWDRNSADRRQRHVDGRVVHAGEAQQRHPVARGDVVERRSQSADAPGQFTVGDGVEVGQQSRSGPPALRVSGEFDGALTQCRSLGVALEHGRDDVGQSHVGSIQGRRDRLVGHRGGELRIGGAQLGDAVNDLRFRVVVCHQPSSKRIWDIGGASLRLPKTTLVKLNVFQPGAPGGCQSAVHRGSPDRTQRRRAGCAAVPRGSLV